MSAPAPADVAALDRAWASRPGLVGWLGAVNHKQIGRRYIATSLGFFAIGGVLAVLLRLQLLGPDMALLTPEQFNALFTMHGTTMMFLFAVPFTEALGIYFAPLMVGARDMPFPRLNAFGYWVYLFGGIFLYASFVTGSVPDGGWFAYVPLTGPEFSPGMNLDFWLLGVTFVEIAGVVAAIEMIVLVLRCRAPGLTLSRIPLFVWAVLVTSIMVVFAFPPLIAGSLMLELDRKVGTVFYDAAAGGDPLLWQHIFWWFGHPEVYIILLPAIGIISTVIPVFARQRLVAYSWVVASTVAIGLVSFGLWVHHMFTTGLSPMALSFFTAGSFLIAIPSGIQIFSWIATIWRGTPVWTVPMHYVAAFIVTFTLGGITGVMVASVPFDWQAHDTYFVVAHLHYVLVGGVVFPVFAGLFFWAPKLTGRMPSAAGGKIGFWLTFVGFHVTFFPQHYLGFLGMPRRVFTFPAGLGMEVHNLVSTLGALVLAAGFAVTLGTLAHGALRGPRAGPDPWGAGTLEWAAASPPANYNFARPPAVRDRYPLWQQVGIDVPLSGFEAWTHEAMRTDGSYREILLTSVLDGVPQRTTTLPVQSLRPLALAASLGLFLLGVLVDAYPLAWIGVIAAAATALAWSWSRQDEAAA